MAERRYPRPRTPPLQNPGRSSLPSFGYPYTEVYTVPIRNDSAGMPRIVSDRAPAPGPIITTTYKVKPELQPARDDRESHRHRRSTHDGAPRPTIVDAQPRSPAIHGGAGRPPSPLHDPYRSSGEDGEYMTIPASSGKRHGHHRQFYSATMDNADVHKLSREAGSRGMLEVGGGREGARYPTRHRPVYPGALVRHPDTVADDYGDNGYGYTNPRDLVQYDLNRSARYPPPRRDSYEGSRPARPTSISGYAEIGPRSYDNRERGPPPATRGLDRLAARSPLYDAPPVRLPPAESGVRSPRKENFYNTDPPRQQAYRRPVSIYQDRPRRDEYYDLRDKDLRERRERPQYSKYDYRERSHRDEANGYDNKRREHRSRKDYDSGNDSDSHDDRAERKNARDKNISREKDHDKRDNHDRKDDHDDHKERKRDKLATGISVAATALGVGAAAKSAKHEDSDDDKDDSVDHKRRRDGDEHRRRREHRDDKGSVDLTGRGPKERNNAREDRDVAADDGGETKARTQQKEDKPVDLAGRNPQEKPATKETHDDGEESKEQRKNKGDPVMDDSAPSSREDSPPSAEATGRRRLHKERGPGPDVPFKATNTNDLRALRDALNKNEGSAPSTAPAEAVREGSFERKREPSTQLEPPSREGRGRRDTSDEEEERRPTPRVVSPPREVKKSEENKPRSILRPPREKFPEDPVPIREGVAPLKDAKKDGVPPDARWTKISRRMVNPEALAAMKERYEAREDFVIVLRVLTKEEIQALAVLTQQIRGELSSSGLIGPAID
jgi:zinc finger CCCH domain-containing protein 13